MMFYRENKTENGRPYRLAKAGFTFKVSFIDILVYSNITFFSYISYVNSDKLQFFLSNVYCFFKKLYVLMKKKLENQKIIL